MGCEIGSITGCVTKSHWDDFVEVFDSIMEERESFYEGFEELDCELTEDGEQMSFEIDIWGLFDDPYKTPLLQIAQAFAKAHPDAQISMDYDLGWDNSGETYYESCRYVEGVLTVGSLMKNPYDGDIDEDKEEEDEEFFDIEDEMEYKRYRFDGDAWAEIK